MTHTVVLPLWLFVLILLFAVVTFASNFLFPSVRWFLRRRAQKVVDELNKRLERPIEPFKLARRTDTIQRLIYDPAVVEAVTEHARETGLREDVAFEIARRYAREIVPGFSAQAYFGVATRAARWLATKLFVVRLHHHEAARQGAVDPAATVVYVMNHRSNMDYVLVTYLVADRAAISYAVGEWARIWPLQQLIRALGGYFIRRRSRNALYRKVLARYVQMATANGVAQAMFPEGGLSQDGRIHAPKLGLLSYIAASFDPEGRDIVFVPVALNYDRVVEDTLLIEARRKGEKRYRGTIPSATAFTLRYVWRRFTRRAPRFGTAAVSFGEPLSLAGLGPGADATDVARELMRRIGQVMPVLPVPLVASLIAGSEGSVARATLRVQIAERVAALQAAGAVILLPEDNPEVALDFGLRQLEMRRMIVVDGEDIRVNPERADLLSYYAASISGLRPAVGSLTRPGASQA